MLAWTCFAGSCSYCVGLQMTPTTKLLRSSGSAAELSRWHIVLHSTLSNSPPMGCYAVQMFRRVTLTTNERSLIRLLEGAGVPTPTTRGALGLGNIVRGRPAWSKRRAVRCGLKDEVLFAYWLWRLWDPFLQHPFHDPMLPVTVSGRATVSSEVPNATANQAFSHHQDRH